MMNNLPTATTGIADSAAQHRLTYLRYLGNVGRAEYGGLLCLHHETLIREDLKQYQCFPMQLTKNALV